MAKTMTEHNTRLITGKTAAGGRSVKIEPGVEHLKEICRQLGVGSSGFLKQKEFMKVCKHFGLRNLQKKEQIKVFKRIDANNDGLISLAELESGLHMTASIHSPTSVPHPQTLMHSQSQKTQALSPSQSKGEKLSTIMNKYQLHDGGTWLFSSVAHSEDGSARSEDVLDLWDRLGIHNGSDILLSFDFNPQGLVNLSDLTAALNDVLADVSSSDPVCLATFIGYQHELKHLRSAFEQVVDEDKKLKLDLAHANAYNSLLSIDIDDRNSQVDKHWESKLLAVDTKYQEQITDLKSELENERETKAADVSRLAAALDEIEKESSQERQQLLAKLTNSQKEIEKQDKALTESNKKIFILSKQNDNFKKDLLNKLQLVESAEEYKQEIQHTLAKTSAENKRLKDENDELTAQLEQTQQKLYLAQRRIELLTNRLPALLTEGVQESSASDSRRANLSTELSQSEQEKFIDSRLKTIEQKYKQALSALEEKHIAEKMTMHENFDQEKKWLIREQKNIEEMLLAEQHRNLQTTFTEEKYDLVQKLETEKNYMKHQYQQEITTLQERLLKAQSQIEDTSMRQLVHHLEMKVAKCQEDIHHFEKKPLSEVRLLQQEVTLRREFEEDRKKLEEWLKPQEINSGTRLDDLFETGIEGLTGKLRDDFFTLVREHTGKEVRQSQAALLNQLQKDRKDMATAVEEEKCQIYEKADSERKALVAKYEKQIAALKTELNEVHSQLEAEKQMVSEMSLKYAKESIASENALETLRKTMERELLIELARITESFESEKRELDDHKIKLEEKLSELDTLLTRERRKTSDIDSLKETIRILMTEKKDMQTITEEIKQKLYKQMNVEREDSEVRLKAIRDEAESQGRAEGLVQGRAEGIAQGTKHGYEKGYSKGLNEGREDGYNQGKKDIDTSMSKSLEAIKTLVESLKREKAIMENELKQEVKKNGRFLQQLQGMEQLKRSFDLLLEEKQTLEDKFTDSLATLAEEHKAEKDHMLKELDKQKAQELFDQTTFDSKSGILHQKSKLISQTEIKQDLTTSEKSGTKLSEDPGSLKKQMIQLSCQLQNTLKVQQELDLLKKDYDLLLEDKSQLEETVNLLKSKAHESDNANTTVHLTQLKTLSEEKQRLQALLDQTSIQLAKASTSMALAQSKFVRELEFMKQKAKHMVQVETYTKLQINLVEHQRLVITLQNALRERESVIDEFIKQTDAETWKVTKMMEAKVKDIQSKLDLTQDELTKYKGKYTQICSQMNQQNVILKDLSVENSGLMKTLADSEYQRKQLEQQKRNMNEKLQTYRKTLDAFYESLSR